MGLDLYAGTLVRYHTGAWESEAQQAAREAGMKFEIAYTGGLPNRLSRVTAKLFIFLWRRRLLRNYSHLIQQGLNWSEAASTPYFARKPDHDGQRALVLAAAHAERPEFTAPIELPQTADLDPAYVSISENYFQSLVSILECHMFLPSAENFIIAGLDAAGTKRLITSTANLAWALDSVNQAHWQADASQIAEWAKRGAVARKTIEVKAGKIVSEEDVPAPENPFEHAAQFGFAVYSEVLAFSRSHQVPIVTDE
jgi:hypothetical protein